MPSPYFGLLLGGLLIGIDKYDFLFLLDRVPSFGVSQTLPTARTFSNRGGGLEIHDTIQKSEPIAIYSSNHSIS